MSNRETYPSQLFPLRGDVSAEAGDISVTVVGIQTTPVESTTPTDGNALVALSGEWVLHTLDGSIFVNELPESDDYSFLVNNVGLEVLVGWAYGFSSQVFVDGAAIP